MIHDQQGVFDIIVMNKDNNPIKSTMDKSVAIQTCGMYESLFSKAATAVNVLSGLEPDDILSLRVRTDKHETIIVPDGKVTFIVFQSAKDCVQAKIV